MKSLLDIVRSCGGAGAGTPERRNPRAKDQRDPAPGQVVRVGDRSLWQDVEFVPKIVEKIGG